WGEKRNCSRRAPSRRRRRCPLARAPRRHTRPSPRALATGSMAAAAEAGGAAVAAGDADAVAGDWRGRWRHVDRLLAVGGPLVGPDYEASAAARAIVGSQARILIVGAGGLGCELAKNLALMGFQQLDIIDMDTID